MPTWCPEASGQGRPFPPTAGRWFSALRRSTPSPTLRWSPPPCTNFILILYNNNYLRLLLLQQIIISNRLKSFKILRKYGQYIYIYHLF